MDARVGLWKGWAPKKNWCFWTVVLEKTLESPLDCKEIQPVHSRGDPALGVLWKEWCWSWNSSTLATSCEELTHWKRLWCWEGLGAGGKGDDRGWDGWMASPTRWTWVWVNSGSWWWTGRPSVLRFMGSQRVGHDWATELNWTEPPNKPCLQIQLHWRLEFQHNLFQKDTVQFSVEALGHMRHWEAYVGSLTYIRGFINLKRGFHKKIIVNVTVEL